MLLTCLLALAVAFGQDAVAERGAQAPGRDAVALAILDLARVAPGDVVYDMGSGDDRIVELAEERYGAEGARIVPRDLFTADVSGATVAILSLSPAVIDRVGAKLKRELRPGARIVSHGLSIGAWRPDAMVQAPDGTPLFLWTVPRRPAREPDILFVPTREVVADQMLQLAGVGPGDVVYDLGSGDGRIVNLAAQKYGARGVGIELDPPLVDIARQVAREAGVDGKVTFIEGDLFTADISGATIVTLYLSPSVNRRLESKLREQLRPGTRVVSHQFPIGRWAPDTVVRGEDGTDLYLWIVRRDPG